MLRFLSASCHVFYVHHVTFSLCSLSRFLCAACHVSYTYAACHAFFMQSVTFSMRGLGLSRIPLHNYRYRYRALRDLNYMLLYWRRTYSYPNVVAITGLLPLRACVPFTCQLGLRSDWPSRRPLCAYVPITCLLVLGLRAHLPRSDWPSRRPPRSPPHPVLPSRSPHTSPYHQILHYVKKKNHTQRRLSITTRYRTGTKLLYLIIK